jgi:RND superfamily putative drug exporter
VITAAATIMVCVFLAFVLLLERQVKMFGLSLASAVFLDAFVIRGLLLPAVPELLGRRTRWFAERLGRRLPRLATEPGPRPRRTDAGRVSRRHRAARRSDLLPRLQPARTTAGVAVPELGLRERAALRRRARRG